MPVRSDERPDEAETNAGVSVPRVLLATRNAGKVAEMQRILHRHLPEVVVLGLADVDEYAEPAETETTFEGNALVKARAGLAATGLPTLADDSGLCVDALNGMPGVLSARWSGSIAGDRIERDRANNQLLLAQLADVPDERRAAAFRCAVAFVRCRDDGSLEEHVADGEMTGSIIRESRGTGGFGYDSLFLPDGEERTSAELPAEEKDARSHRGAALRAVAPEVAKALTGS